MDKTKTTFHKELLTDYQNSLIDEDRLRKIYKLDKNSLILFPKDKTRPYDNYYGNKDFILISHGDSPDSHRIWDAYNTEVTHMFRWYCDTSRKYSDMFWDDKYMTYDSLKIYLYLCLRRQLGDLKKFNKFFGFTAINADKALCPSTADNAFVLLDELIVCDNKQLMYFATNLYNIVPLKALFAPGKEIYYDHEYFSDYLYYWEQIKVLYYRQRKSIISKEDDFLHIRSHNCEKGLDPESNFITIKDINGKESVISIRSISKITTDYVTTVKPEYDRYSSNVFYNRAFGKGIKHYLSKDELHKVIQAFNVEIFNKD